VWASTPGFKVYAERFLTDQYISKAKQLGAVAAETGGTVLDLAFGWLLSRPYVASVMASVSKAEQLEENVKAAAWRPTSEQLKRIDEISPPPAAAHYAEVVTDDLRKRGYSAG
jgi:aryl-alcohol dehydrogenase-like predicted oxidoreductase